MKCQKCQKEFNLLSVEDRNDLNHIWSDAMIGNAFCKLNDEHLYYCPNCKHYFWADDYPNIEVDKTGDLIIDPNNIKEQFNQLFKVLVSNIEFYRKAKRELNHLTFEQELYINIKLLRAINSLRRPYSRNNQAKSHAILGKFSFFKLKAIILLEQKYNFYRNTKYNAIYRILEMIENRGFAIEMELYRELRQFKKVIELYNKFQLDSDINLDRLYFGCKSLLYKREDLENMINQIKKKAHQKNSKIFEL